MISAPISGALLRHLQSPSNTLLETKIQIFSVYRGHQLSEVLRSLQPNQVSTQSSKKTVDVLLKNLQQWFTLTLLIKSSQESPPPKPRWEWVSVILCMAENLALYHHLFPHWHILRVSSPLDLASAHSLPLGNAERKVERRVKWKSAHPPPRFNAS